jgi:CheY-like chemotaxis protein
MRVLIADDDVIPRLMLQASLARWGYEVAVVADGLEAWQVLQQPDAPKLVLLDWMMPGLDGVEVCRRLREQPTASPPYVLLLTGRGAPADVVGLGSGANDYLTKPFEHEELRARLGIRQRMLELQDRLLARVQELEEALAHVKQLEGLVPICCYCKRIRDDQNYWEQVEAYICRHSNARLSHGICPDCWEQRVQPELEKDRQRASAHGAESPPAG